VARIVTFAVKMFIFIIYFKEIKIFRNWF